MQISRISRTFIACLSVLTVLSTQATANEQFLYRYKLAPVVGSLIDNPTSPTNPTNPGNPTTPGDDTGGVDPVDPGTGGEEPPLTCEDDPDCFTDRTEETDYPEPVIAPIRRVFVGEYLMEDEWFNNTWQSYVTDEDGYWLASRLVVNSDNLPDGIEPYRQQTWGTDEERLTGSITGQAQEPGTGRVVFDIEVLREGDVWEKVSELVVRVAVESIPADIVAPTQNLYVGDSANSYWFAKQYGGLIGPYGDFALVRQSGSAPTGTVASEEIGSFTGIVGETGSFTTVFGIHVVSWNEDYTERTIGSQVSRLTIRLNAQPNLHQLALITLPEEEGSSLLPITFVDTAMWDPQSDFDSYNHYRRYNYSDELIVGATIAGLEPGSCPGGVTWSFDDMDVVPPSMRMREVSDGFAMLHYRMDETPNGAGYDVRNLPYEYENVRVKAICKDANGDTMVIYRSTLFTIRVAQPS